MKRTKHISAKRINQALAAAALTGLVVAGAPPATAAPDIPLNAAAAVLAAGTTSIDISGITITAQPSDVTRDVLVNPFTQNEQLGVTFKVRNTRSTTVTVVPTAGDFIPFTPNHGQGNCRWTNLAPGASYECVKPKHTVTAADLAQGYFQPVTSWQVGGETKTLTTPAIALRANVATAVGQVSISGTPANPARNTTSNPYSAGEKLAYNFTVKNNGTTAVSVEPLSGPFAALLPGGGAENCRRQNLAAGASYTCSTAEHTVTRAELDRGYFLPTTVWRAGTTEHDVVADAAKLGTPLADPDNAYLGAPPADRGLGFHDVDKDGNTRAIRDDLATGNLNGMVEFAQNLTVNPSGNDAREMQDLVAKRAALLLFTPENPTSSVTVAAKVNGVAKGSFTMNAPVDIPQTDANFPGTRPKVVYSKRAWTVDLPWDVILPGLELSFTAADGANGTLPASNITMGPPTELVINNIELGMLTTPNMSGDHAFINQPAQAGADYFQTIPVSKLIMAKYQTVQLEKVIVANGNIYTPSSPSVTNGDVYSGDMRENVGKAQVSTGINLANFGMTSGPMNQVQPGVYNQRIIHHSAGLYANGRVEHGLSGGNGMATIYSSSGNELSHELGHSYGLGHYPGQNNSLPGDAATINATHHSESGWGWNAYRDAMRPNITTGGYSASGVDINGKPFSQTFANSYNYLRDAMSGGWPEGNYSRYTLHTGYSADRIQENLKTVVPDLAYPSGYRTWDPVTGQYVDAKAANASFNYLKPSAVGVEVVTLLGGYVPADSMKAVLYPAFRSNWGNSFDYPAPVLDGPAETRVCWMDVSYLNGANKKFAVSGAVSGVPVTNALQFNINIAAADKPSGASLFCKQNGTTTQYGNSITIATDAPAMTPAVTIGQDAGYNAVKAAELPVLETALSAQAGAAYPQLGTDAAAALRSWKGDLSALSATAQTVAAQILDREEAADQVGRFLRYHADSLNTQETKDRFRALLTEAGLAAASGPVTPAGGAVKVDKGNSGVTAGYCLKLYTLPDGGIEARVPTAAQVASECTGAANEKWFMDVRGAVHNAAQPGLCLTTSNPGRPADCDPNNASQRWEYGANSHLYPLGNTGRSLDLNRATRFPIMYGTGNSSNQVWEGLTSTDTKAWAALDGASLAAIATMGL